VVGVVTSDCVEVAVRDAADRSFEVILVEDATVTWSAEMHRAAMWTMNEIYTKLKSADQVLASLRAFRAPVAVGAGGDASV
jgi:nicotinamidase-related amidase